MAAKIMNQVERVSEKKWKNFDYESTLLNGLTKMRVNQKVSGRPSNHHSLKLILHHFVHQYSSSLNVDAELIYVHKHALAIASNYLAATFEDMHSCKELHNVSDKYILDHLNDLIAEKDLLLFSFEEYVVWDESAFFTRVLLRCCATYCFQLRAEDTSTKVAVYLSSSLRELTF
uniref:BTB domain-containing protein n=1 Tax=Glossina palpalis gambiensis TaxID=67801 RepID=A0A1B0BGR2_9MUSC